MTDYILKDGFVKNDGLGTEIIKLFSHYRFFNKKTDFHFKKTDFILYTAYPLTKKVKTLAVVGFSS